jgi:hypothetical protein
MLETARSTEPADKRVGKEAVKKAQEMDFAPPQILSPPEDE